MKSEYAMNSIQMHTGIAGFGVLVLLTLPLASPALAGPGPQFWAQQESLRSGKTQHANATAPKRELAQSMACTRCKTRIHEERSRPNLADPSAPVPVRIGRRHYCGACRGMITRLGGRVDG